VRKSQSKRGCAPCRPPFRVSTRKKRQALQQNFSPPPPCQKWTHSPPPRPLPPFSFPTLLPPLSFPSPPSPLALGRAPPAQAQEREERLRLLFLQQPDHSLLATSAPPGGRGRWMSADVLTWQEEQRGGMQRGKAARGGGRGCPRKSGSRPEGHRSRAPEAHEAQGQQSRGEHLWCTRRAGGQAEEQHTRGRGVACAGALARASGCRCGGGSGGGCG